MKYLHKFTSIADFQAAYNGQDYIEPWVSLTVGSGEATGFVGSYTDYTHESENGPFTFTLLEVVDDIQGSF